MEHDVTRSIEEQLSAFLDGELADEELQLLVRRLERDDAYRATLVRYSHIGNILRNESVHTSVARFRVGIMAALEDESAAPGSSAATADKPERNWFRPAASVAAAAVLVVGLINLNVFDSLSPVESAPVAATAESAAGVTAAAVPQRIRRASVNSERMTSYFVSHGEYARSFQGPMGDSRIFIQQARYER